MHRSVVNIPLPVSPLSLTQTDYCFDSLLVEIRDGGDVTHSSQHVLLPTVNEDESVSLRVESGLEKDGHFTALVYFNSSLLTQTNFCEKQCTHVYSVTAYGHW